jgi:hypothetical protein
MASLSPTAAASPKRLRVYSFAAPAYGDGAGSGKRVGTHNGSFHCDEALDCFLIRLTIPRFLYVTTRLWAERSPITDVKAQARRNPTKDIYTAALIHQRALNRNIQNQGHGSSPSSSDPLGGRFWRAVARLLGGDTLCACSRPGGGSPVATSRYSGIRALPFLGVGVAAVLSTKFGGEAPLRPRFGRWSIFPDLLARDSGAIESGLSARGSSRAAARIDSSQP